MVSDASRSGRNLASGCMGLAHASAARQDPCPIQASRCDLSTPALYRSGFFFNKHRSIGSQGVKVREGDQKRWPWGVRTMLNSGHSTHLLVAIDGFEGGLSLKAFYKGSLSSPVQLLILPWAVTLVLKVSLWLLKEMAVGISSVNHICSSGNMGQILTHLLGLWMRKLQPSQVNNLLVVTSVARPGPFPSLSHSCTCKYCAAHYFLCIYALCPSVGW